MAGVGLVDLAYKNLPLASLFKGQNSNKVEETQEPVYSFYKDDDRDGLSNAWEYVFGSEAKKADTDGDGYSDKKEVDNGYDPLIAGEGKGRLEERKAENLSIDYYVFCHQKGIKPEVENMANIRKFAHHNHLLSIKKVSKTKVNLNSDNSQEALNSYLVNLDNLSFPQAAFDYQTLAENYSKKAQPQLDDLISRVDLALSDLKQLQPPKQAVDIQRNYLTILQTFRVFLEDLKKAKQDPVRIKINVLKAPQLIELAMEAENLKERLRD